MRSYRRFQFLQILDQHRVILNTRVSELILQCLGRQVVDGLNLQNGRLPETRPDGSREPLKTLLILRRVGQERTRIAKSDGAKSLQLSPDLNALTCLARGQGEDQQEPSCVLLHRCYIHNTRVLWNSSGCLKLIRGMLLGRFVSGSMTVPLSPVTKRRVNVQIIICQECCCGARTRIAQRCRLLELPREFKAHFLQPWR